jgi:hypothetical protein
LCGAAVDGTLFLVTGLHTGKVDFAVELYDEAPPIDDTWEEIVEASYRPAGDVALIGWGGEGHWPLDLDEVDYRVRYCGWGMDAGHQAAPPMDGEPLVDRYLLQFWPAPPTPDRVIKLTSAQAAYWHREAQRTPPPPTAEGRAQAKLERERRAAEERRAEQLQAWGGSLPSDRVRDVYAAFHLAQLDRPLLDAVEGTDPDIQRAIARWAARRACVEAGLDQVDWIAGALGRMDDGEDVEDVFRPPPGAFGAEGEGALISTFGGWNESLDPPAQALVVLSTAYDDDPLHAALETLWLAVGVSGDGRKHQVISELRQAFPELTNPGG